MTVFVLFMLTRLADGSIEPSIHSEWFETAEECVAVAITTPPEVFELLCWQGVML